MILKLNHVALAVPSLESAMTLYQNIFGAVISPPKVLEEHGIRLSFVRLQNTALELMEPLDDTSPISRFLKRTRDGGIHHLCFEVADLEASMKQLATSGLRILGNGKPKLGAHGKPVIFLHPKDCLGVLVELEQV